MTRYALVPVEPDAKTVKAVVVAMGQALASPARVKDGPINMIESMRHVAEAGAIALIAAAPNAGQVADEMVDKAAAAHSGAPFPSKRARDRMRLALEAIGLQMEPPK